jgi:hypothetical protein
MAKANIKLGIVAADISSNMKSSKTAMNDYTTPQQPQPRVQPHLPRQASQASRQHPLYSHHEPEKQQVFV